MKSPYWHRIEAVQGNYLEDLGLPKGDIVISIAPGPGSGDRYSAQGVFPNRVYPEIAAVGAARQVAEKGQIYIVGDFIESKEHADKIAGMAVAELRARGLAPLLEKVTVGPIRGTQLKAGANPLGIRLESVFLTHGPREFKKWWSVYVDLR